MTRRTALLGGRSCAAGRGARPFSKCGGPGSVDSPPADRRLRASGAPPPSAAWWFKAFLALHQSHAAGGESTLPDPLALSERAGAIRPFPLFPPAIDRAAVEPVACRHEPFPEQRHPRRAE